MQAKSLLKIYGFDENHGRTTVLAHKALKDLDKTKAEIERLSKPYVPMTDKEWREYFDDDMSGLSYNFYREIEAHIIKRLGLEIKHD